MSYIDKVKVGNTIYSIEDSRVGDLTNLDTTEKNTLVGAINEACTIGVSGQPVAVTLASGMTDTDTIYLYLGDEEGYDYGYVYVYLNGAWTKTNVYGATTVQDGSITEPKLASALATKINDKADTSALTIEATARQNADTSLRNQISSLQGVSLKTIGTVVPVKDSNDGLMSAQGMCVHNEFIYQAFVNSDDTAGYINKAEIGGDAVVTSKDLSGYMYHSNGLCYHNGYIYLACGGGTKNIVQLNETSLDVVQTYILNIDVASFSAGGIGVYDNEFYVFNTNDTKVYKFESLSSECTGVIDCGLHDYASNVQSVAFFNDKMYFPANNPPVIIVATLDGEVENVINLNISGEPEAVYEHNGNMLVAMSMNNTYQTFVEYSILTINNPTISDMANYSFTANQQSNAIRYISASSIYLKEDGTSDYPYKTFDEALKWYHNQSAKNGIVFVIKDNSTYPLLFLADSQIELRTLGTNIPTISVVDIRIGGGMYIDTNAYSINIGSYTSNINPLFKNGYANKASKEYQLEPNSVYLATVWRIGSNNINASTGGAVAIIATGGATGTARITYLYQDTSFDPFTVSNCKLTVTPSNSYTVYSVTKLS